MFWTTTVIIILAVFGIFQFVKKRKARRTSRMYLAAKSKAEAECRKYKSDCAYWKRTYERSQNQ